MCLGFEWHGSVQISNGVQILNGKISHFVCSAIKVTIDNIWGVKYSYIIVVIYSTVRKGIK